MLKGSVPIFAVITSFYLADGWITGTCIPHEYPEADSYMILTYDDDTGLLADRESLDVGETYLTGELHSGYYYQWCVIYNDGHKLSQLGKVNLHVQNGITLISNFYNGFYGSNPGALGLLEVTWGLFKAISTRCLATDASAVSSDELCGGECLDE